MEKTIKELIHESIIEFNDSGVSKKISTEENAYIFGENSELDSLGFVSFVVILEEKLFDLTGEDITIVSDKAFSKKYNPFKTVNQLEEFIVELLEEKKNVNSDNG